MSNQGMYSNFQEEAVIKKYISGTEPGNRFVVDIAADDGRSMSNTFRLYSEGYHGVAVECNPKQFAKLSDLYAAFPDVQLLRTKVTPENVNMLLAACGTPKNFSFLSLDIDSYDYFLLKEILSEYSPSLICAEINEIIPPPIKFSVKYDPGHFWSKDHFMGQSICQLHSLCEKRGYDLVELHYNNAFLIPHALNKNRFPKLSPEKAYKEGYLDKPDRLEKLPWNRDVEQVQGMPVGDAKIFFEKLFENYRGKYILE